MKNKSYIGGADVRENAFGGGVWMELFRRAFIRGPVAAVVLAAALAASGADDYAYRQLGRDRVLLMNNDTNPLNPITFQGYYDTNTTDVAYWVHDGPAPSGSYNGNYFYLKEGTNHTYYASTSGGVKKLWQLRSCRAGSGAGGTSANNLSSRHYLPWSKTTEPIDYNNTSVATAVRTMPIPATHAFSGTNAKQGIKQSANVVMRNDINAALFSPYYENGIGSVYFDAVNGQNPTASITDTIALYAATNTTDGVDAAEADVATNSWNWIKIPAARYAVTSCSDIETLDSLESPAEDILLDASSSYNRTNCFFRIHANVQEALGGYTGPACFKIVRLTGNDGNPVDTSRLVILDNIQVSYPVSPFSLEQFGHEDFELTGRQAVGRAGVFSVPFPAAGQDGVCPRASFSNDLSFLPDGENDLVAALAIDSAKLHYRWRYLNQMATGWSEIDLTPDYDTGLLSGDALDLDVGAGDLEYYFAATYSTTHYKPIDYALCTHTDDIEFLGWSDSYQNSFSAELRRTDDSDYENGSPSLGTDYFVRLREGSSNYEAFNIDLCWGDDYSTATNIPETITGLVAMELVADGTWRGVWEMPTNAVGAKLYVAFKGSNRQTDGSTEWSENETFFVPAAQVDSWPASGLVKSSSGVDARQDSPMEISSAANVLVFTFEEESLTYSVARGDYQNFNRWTNAQGTVFTGNMAATTGVSRAQSLLRAPVSSWVTNYFLTSKMVSIGDGEDTTRWEEHFLPMMAYDDIQIGVERSGSTTTPNGWDMENGAYVPERGVLLATDKSGSTFTNVAAQLCGCGQGSLAYTGASRPEGIDTVSFRARVGQMVDFADFSQNLTCVGETNYVVAAKAVLAKSEEYISPVDPSISLLAYYRQNQGSYEMRVSRVVKSINRATTNFYFRVELYRWNCTGGRGSSTLLHRWYLGQSGTIPSESELASNETRYVCSPSTMMCESGATNAPSFYLGAYNDYSKNAVNLFCGVGIAANQRTIYNDMPSQNGGIVMLTTNMTSSAINTGASYSDNSGQRLMRGTYGLYANNCRAVFRHVFHTPILASGAVGNETFQNINESTLAEAERTAMVTDGDWGLPKMTCDSSYSYVGTVPWVSAKPAEQTINVAVRETSGGDWTTCAEVDLSSYAFISTNITLRYQPDAQLKLFTGGSKFDERVDVVVDDVSFTRLRGADHPGLENSDGTRNWMFTQAWPTTSSSTQVVSFQPVRGLTNLPMSVRTDYITNGVSVLGFSWMNADPGVSRVMIQTNGVARSGVNSASTSVDASTWVTVTNLTLSTASGTFANAFKCRAPFNGVFRVMVDPSVVADAVADKTLSTSYGRVDISNIYYWDDPSLSGDFWWGWNMRTSNEDNYSYLPDASIDPETGVTGLSGILNYTARTDQTPDFETYPEGVVPQWEAHSPFVQSPYLSNGVGKIVFKARAFDNTNTLSSVWYPSTVALYGVKDDTDASDGDWEQICDPFIVSNATFATYTWETHDVNSAYRAIRFVVRGAQNGRRKVDQPTGDGIEENLINYYAVDDYARAAAPNAIMRLCLDEITLAEVVSPKLGFRNAMPFRDDLDGTNSLADAVLMDYSQQPLLEESFGFQVQIVPEQMRELIDFSSLKVYFTYHVGKDAWGYANWSNDCVEVELPKAADWSEDRMVYRSRADIAPDSIVEAVMMDEYSSAASAIVQYSVKLVYSDTDGNEYTTRLTDDTSRYWTNPSWYGSYDANSAFTSSTSSENYTPYTVLETLSPKRAWINEVNLWDRESWSSTIPNQFLEVAVPAGVSLKGWTLRLTQRNDAEGEEILGTSQTLALFGYNDLPDTKSTDTVNDYAFLAVKSPKSTCEASGSWLPISVYGEDLGGKLPIYRPYALELIRPSGIVEHQIVFGGQNLATNSSQRLYERYSSEKFYTNITNYYGSASDWIYIGDDTNTHSIAVCTTNGETSIQWRESSEITPGKVNLFDDGATEQFIVPGWYLTPNGDTCWIRAYLTGSDIYQSVGDGAPTAIFHVKKFIPSRYDESNPATWGGGTNIVYTASAWHYVASLTTNSVPVAEIAAAKNSTFTLTITNVTDSVSIYAAAGRNYDTLEGLTSGSRYSDEVFDWIVAKSPDEEAEIYLADVNPAAGATLPTDSRMPLEEMYWLDIDPFTTNAFYIGMEAIPEVYPQVGEDASGNLTNAYGTVVVETKAYQPALTNYGVTVYAYVSNVQENVVWKPEYLQGVGGANSADFTSGGWTGPSFKVRGYLLGHTLGDGQVTAPLRNFIIDSESFEAYPVDNSPYSALVHVTDPFSSNSPANVYPYFWARWNDETDSSMWRGKTIYWRFTIDDEQLGSDPGILK